jgi:hypothetical protein
MRGVSVELGPEGDAVARALDAAGFAAASAAPWARVVEAREGTFEDATPLVSWVLEGGVLAICGGTGPLLAALHLTPGADLVEGPAAATAPEAPPVEIAEAWPVTGVGYALYRAPKGCVALAGRRGLGWVVYALDPALLAASLSWVASRGTA